MAKKDLKPIAQEVLKLVGGKNNISSFTNCQTRLRINVKDSTKVDIKALGDVDTAFGANMTGQQAQVIFGTGKVVKMADAFGKIANIQPGQPEDASDNSEDLKDVAAKVKAKQKEQNTSVFQKFLGKFANIFAPLILGFIGAGILAGIAGIIQSTNPTSAAAISWMHFLSTLLNIWKGTFLIIVGWRCAQVFGGSGVIGAIIAGLYVTAFSGQVTGWFVPDGHGQYSFLGVHIGNGAHNWLTSGLRPGDVDSTTGLAKLAYPSGSVFGVMISAGIVGITEKGLRKFIPASLDTVLTPTIALLLLLILNVVLIMPVSGYIFKGVSFLFENLYGNPFGAALLAALFLITVVFGIHQGFVPVYSALLTSTGVNGLFPILAMAGAGQVGMALALWLRAEKDGKLRRQIQGAIIPGFLGIGEPLIYGVSLPRVKPFITASIGGAIGGFFIGAFNLWGSEPIGLNTMFGPSGLLATPLMTTPGGSVVTGIIIYLGGLLVSYASGFVVTYYFGHKGVDLK